MPQDARLIGALVFADLRRLREVSGRIAHARRRAARFLTCRRTTAISGNLRLAVLFGSGAASGLSALRTRFA